MLAEKTMKRQIKYPTIGADAKALGRSRPYLWKVLEGKEPSVSLLRRYHALKAKQRRAG